MKVPWLSLLFLALCILCTHYQWGLLYMDQPSLGAVLSCHFPHLSNGQLFYAGVVAMLFAALCEQQIGPRRFVLLWFFSAIIVSFSVLAFERPFIEYYCGASGIGHAFAACWATEQDKKAVKLFFILALMSKLSFELATGSVSYEIGLEGARAVPLAHVAGAITGFIGSAVFRKISLSESRTSPIVSP